MKRDKKIKIILGLMLILVTIFPVDCVKATTYAVDMRSFFSSLEEKIRKESYVSGLREAASCSDVTASGRYFRFYHSDDPGYEEYFFIKFEIYDCVWNNERSRYEEDSIYYSLPFGLISLKPNLRVTAVKTESNIESITLNIFKNSIKTMAELQNLNMAYFENYYNSLVQSPLSSYNEDILENDGVIFYYWQYNGVKNFGINFATGLAKYPRDATPSPTPSTTPSPSPSPTPTSSTTPSSTPIPSNTPSSTSSTRPVPSRTPNSTVTNPTNNQQSNLSTGTTSNINNSSNTDTNTTPENPNTGIYYCASLLLIVAVFSGIFYSLMYKKNKFPQV